MKIFLSWSGARSKGVAECLHKWLPNVLQVADPFLSSIDIRAGQDFTSVLRGNLAESDFGIICLTRENCRRPWMLFEAGAIAKAFNRSNVCPYLIDMSPTDLPSPLNFFHAVSSNEGGTSKLVGAINSASELLKLSESRLQKSFKRWWPDLNAELEALEKKTISLSLASSATEFFVLNVKSNEYLQANGAKRKNGADASLAAFNGSKRQKWSFHELGGSCFAIRSVYTTQVLDGTSLKEGTKVHQWEFHGDNNQRWLLDPKGAGDCRLRCELNSRCITINENRLSLKDETNSRSQLWRLVPVLM